jgi:hypothetical protein
LREVDAIAEVADAAALAAAVSALLRDDATRRARAERAFEAVQLYAGLPAYTAEALLGLLPPSC